jgi:vacuolar-type H+-ATPase subunit E/Vma4
MAENNTEKKTESTEKKTVAERTADLTERAAGLSDEVLKSVESGQRAAIDAVRKFVGAVDESMPAHGDDHPSRRNTIVDAALDMADKLVKTQYEFIRSVVSSANETLHKQGDAKPSAD